MLTLDDLKQRFELFNLVDVSVVGTDMDARVIVWNAAAERQFDITAADAIGEQIQDLIPWVESPIPRSEAIAMVLAGERFNGEVLIRKPDGSTRWVDLSINRYYLPEYEVGGTFAVAKDISSHKAAAEEARAEKEEDRIASNQRFRDLLDQSPIATVVYAPDGRPLFANQAQIKYTRISPEMVEQFFAHYNVLEDPQLEAAGAMPALRRGFAGEPVSLPPIQYFPRDLEGVPDRPPVWLTSQIFPVKNSAGEVTEVVTILIDISEQTRAEEERKKLDAQVQQTQKMESLGVLAGGIAHDFNNLLVGILGNASLAMTDLPPDAPERESLEGIETAARRAADLARQLLAYSGRGRFIISALSISALVQEMVHLLEISISKKATLNLRFAEDLAAIEGDATQIRQITMNLVTNASEALGDETGVIAISTGIQPCDAAYLQDTYLADDLEPGDYVYLEVSDSGCGMTRDQLDRIFDPFFTTKFTGRGLGLAAVLGIVRGHHGAIKVKSEPDVGTTFQVLFPALVGQPEAKASDERDGLWRGSGAVLFVDDDENVRTVGTRALTKLGFEVVIATDGREAVDAFRARADEIVLVVLDLTMPGLDGAETFGLLKEIREEIPIVLSSGYTEKEVGERFAGRGMTGFLQKPFTFKSLSKIIREALD